MGSKKIYPTLAEGVQRDLEAWADYQGRPVANLAAYLIERGIEEAKERGEFQTRAKQQDTHEGLSEEELTMLRSFLSDLSNQQSLEKHRLAELANILGIETAILVNLGKLIRR